MKPHSSPMRALLILIGGSALALLSARAQLQWDANGTAAGQTNGGGAWLGTNLWWNGSSNQNWVSGSNAIFGGPNTAGGAVTLASPTTVGSITSNTFTGTYTLGSSTQMITLNGGLTNQSAAGAVTIASPVTLSAPQTWTNHSTGMLTSSAVVDTNGHTLTIAGSGPTTPSGGITGTGALVKNGTSRLVLRPGTHDFSGGLTLNGGVTMVDGVTADKMGSGNLTLNGGVLEFYWAYTLNRTLGPAAGQMRLPGGESGFAMNGATGSTIRFNNSSTFELVWGGDDFNPSALVLNSASSQAGAALTFDNPIDLKGANRTLRSDAIAPAVTATMARAIRNTGATPAGLIKTGPGQIRPPLMAARYDLLASPPCPPPAMSRSTMAAPSASTSAAPANGPPVPPAMAPLAGCSMARAARAVPLSATPARSD